MNLSCKILTLVLLGGCLNLANAQIGSAPKTFGQQTYPNSGSTKNRGNLMGGRTLSAAAASDRSQNSPDVATPEAQKQEQQENEEFKIGPYDKDGNYKVFIPGK